MQGGLQLILNLKDSKAILPSALTVYNEDRQWQSGGSSQKKFLRENSQKSQNLDFEWVRKILEMSKNRSRDSIILRLIIVKSDRKNYQILSLIQQLSMEEITSGPLLLALSCLLFFCSVIGLTRQGSALDPLPLDPIAAVVKWQHLWVIFPDKQIHNMCNFRGFSVSWKSMCESLGITPSLKSSSLPATNQLLNLSMGSTQNVSFPKPVKLTS